MELSLITVAIIVFTLACFIGYFVVWGVTPALHTPLMAVTNAISGIVIVAAILIAGQDDMTTFFQSIKGSNITANQAATALDNIHMAKILGFFAVILASINIFGGFAITRRMLAMFRKKEEK